MIQVYALKSEIKNIIYVGLTVNLEKRFKQHNSGVTNWSKRYRPWKVIYSESFLTRVEARIREKQLKSGSGKEFLKNLKT